MVYPTWKIWARTLLLFHVGALVLAAILFPFTRISYIAFAFSTLSLWTIGLLIGDIYGHREFKSQLVSRGLTIISTLSSTAAIAKVASTINSKSPLFLWIPSVIYWVCFFLPLVYGFLMFVLFSITKVHAHTPKGWTLLCCVMGVLFILLGLSTLLIPVTLLPFQILGVLTVIGYVIWGLWFAYFLKDVERV